MVQKTVKKKTKIIPKLRASGSISVSNLNSKKSECITLTYSIKNVGSLANVKHLAKELDNTSGLDDGAVEVLITAFNTKAETIDMKYKVKNCEDTEDLRTVKEDLDKYLKLKGGQTTLDET
jgi:hypothetical protein